MSGDCRLVPLNEAVIVVVPAETPVTEMAALEAPAGTVTGVCTVATLGLLLVNETVTPCAGAAPARVTVP
jgi:hypothetical protein